MRTCKNGHALLAEAQRFCGECGSEAAGDETSCGCGATLAKGVKFCGECGAAAGPLTGDLGSALDEVESYIKARAGITDDLTLPVLDPEDQSGAEDVDRILKAAAVRDADTGEEIGVDAVPVVGAFMKGQSDLAAASQMYAEHLTELARAQLDGQTAMMKAVVLIGRTVEKLASAPTGPRVLGPGAGPAIGLGAEPMAKGNGAAMPAGQFDGLRGADLLVKATVAAQRNPSLLTTMELAAVEHFGNNDASLADIKGINAELASRVEAALRETQAH
jgi:hypothetical protein